MHDSNFQNQLPVEAESVAQNYAQLHTSADLQSADTDSLTCQQLKGVQLLALGNSISTTAASLGASRRTIYNWLGDPAFKHCVNRLRHKPWDQANDRLRALVH